ncbi:MAG: radical SAM protein [Thermoguttaceae bacterium]|jgi:wyosine [tRNA(Phe)-imidazoG37] synthetase (radical SAM superfamily)
MTPAPLVSLFQTHPRSFEDNRFVYAVVSRRAGGVSIGVNLNPEKYCNFDCVYCQVDRTVRGGPVLRKIDLPQLAAELDEMVELAVTGRLFEGTRFSTTPAEYRRLNDIAMSGDGEPTSSPIFDEVVQLCADIRRRRGLEQVKLVLITNATLFQRERVRRSLEVLDANNGEIWGKLDAGTEEYYQAIDRSKVRLAEVLENLVIAARQRPIVIQSLFMRLRNEPPPLAEKKAYCDRLCEIVTGGGQIKLVQIHTIARRPAESFASPLENAEVDALAELVKNLTGLAVATCYGSY